LLKAPEQRQANTIRLDLPLRGTHLVLVVEDDNNELLVVKPHNPPDSRWIVPNELLAALLGRAIGGPFLEPYLVHLDQDVIDASGITQRKSYAAQMLGPGIGFSIPYFEERQEGNLNTTDLKLLSNPEEVIPILILDCWLWNIDRDNPGNLLFVKEKSKSKAGNGNPQFTMYGIDHAYIFNGQDWDSQELVDKRQEVEVQKHLPIMKDLAWRGDTKTRVALVKDYIQKVKSLSKTDFTWMLNQLPTAWGVSSSEKSAIMDYIIERQVLVEGALKSHFMLP
jgi:hypothetical protein